MPQISNFSPHSSLKLLKFGIAHVTNLYLCSKGKPTPSCLRMGSDPRNDPGNIIEI